MRKKIIILSMSTLMTIALLAGCGSVDTSSSTDDNSKVTQEETDKNQSDKEAGKGEDSKDITDIIDITRDHMEETTGEEITDIEKITQDSIENTEETTKDKVENVTTEVDTTGRMLVAEAKKIVLEHAGLKEDDVKFTEIEGDTEDRREIYELEFETINKPYRYFYEYKIDAITGEILETTLDTIQGVTGNVAEIDEKKVKEIVLADVGVNEEEVIYEKVELEYDADDDDAVKYKYIIEFKVNGKEYEYEVDAITGAILEKELD